MYIGKDGTLVEAEKIEADDDYYMGDWLVTDSDNLQRIVHDKDFQEQYGEAMICPYHKNCKPHIKHETCGVYGCIPYIPEQKLEVINKSTDIDREKFVGTNQHLPKGWRGRIIGNNTIRDSNYKENIDSYIEQSNLMLSDEEICKTICGKRKCENTDCSCFNEARRILQAELDHLKGLGIVYVRDLTKCGCIGCQNDKTRTSYIPLSDYKGEK